MRKLTTKEVIRRSKYTHGDRYDYSLVEYVNRRTKIKIICPIHGIFEQKPDLHYKRGYGCPQCGGTARLTTNEFVRRATGIHNGKFDYSLVNYKAQKDKVKIICPIHGIFTQSPHDHLEGKGCKECYLSNSSKQVFVSKARSIHGNKYDYSKVRYLNSRSKVEIICPIHGSFFQQPNNHILGRGCRQCAIDQWVPPKKIDQNTFIKRARKTHGNRYDYSKVCYDDIFTKIKIICRKHGVFNQRPSDHIDGRGCPVCAKVSRIESVSIGFEIFLKRARKIHGKRYGYNKTTYKNLRELTEIECPKHGIFMQEARVHLSGAGCPICKQSHGERKISKILKGMKLDFVRQKTFKKCKREILLRFDFFLRIGNITFLIEYDGEQHFAPVEYFGGQEAFKKTQERDAIKTQFAKDNGFILIRIPYTEFDNIQSILERELSPYL